MAKNLDNLRTTLFSAKDGGTACDAINALGKRAKKGDGEAKRVLADYAHAGSIGHMREHACACLAGAVTHADVELVAMFQKGLSDSQIRYWSILGYINSAGKGAYEELAKLANDGTIQLAERTQAVKCLATFSKQPFDRQLPSDPGHWKETDLRISEVVAWAKAGYPDGKGFSEPSRHPALDDPKTEFERIVSRLDKKLAKKRRERQDLADPTEWLALADPADIQRIKARWDLPSTYLDFLARFSPIKMTIANEGSTTTFKCSAQAN